MEKSVFGVGVLPNPWPPPQKVQLLANEENGLLLSLLIDNRGRFVASVSQDNIILQEKIFGPIEVPSAARFIFSLIVSAAEFQLYINGHEIPCSEHGMQSVHLPYPEKEQPPIGLVLQNLNPDFASTTEERFFLQTLIDIASKAVTRDRYSLIRASGLLRQLLLDGLLHAVNRNHRVPIEFCTIDFTSRLPVEIEISAHWQNLDPSYFPGAKTIKSTLDQFLAAPCLNFQGSEADVKDLIRACANAKGGIHLGRTRIQEEQVVLDWDEAIKMLGEEPSLMALAGICRVVLVGTQGLVKSIMDVSAKQVD